MAEAYFNSLHLKNAQAISSGSVAKLHSESNKRNFEITQTVLDKHNLTKYTKARWDQLDQARIDEGDVTVYLSESVKAECEKLFRLPENSLVWDIPDFDEVTLIPTTDEEIREYAEKVLKLVVADINKLAATL
jgi:hypothetical protein